MSREFDIHPGDDDIERYALRNLPEEDLERFEEHLLVCVMCQDRLKSADDTVLAFRTAAAELVPSRPWWKRILPGDVRWQTGLGFGLATAMLLVLLGPLQTLRNPSPDGGPAMVVRMTSLRGELPKPQLVPSGRSLHLVTPLDGLPEARQYTAEVVSDLGSLVWSGECSRAADSLAIDLPNGLGPGRYYVRLRDPSGQVLIEYLLAVTPR